MNGTLRNALPRTLGRRVWLAMALILSLAIWPPAGLAAAPGGQAARPALDVPVKPRLEVSVARRAPVRQPADA